MPVDNIIKKKIQQDWLMAFPELSLYNKDKLYKLVGPLILGLELIKLPRTDEYRPHFVIYSLFGNMMGNDVKVCLAGPILLQEYSNKKGLQYNIPYEKHDFFFEDVLKSINSQTPLSFEGNISLKKILDTLDEYSQTSPLSAAPNSYMQAALQATKLKIALYIGEKDALNVFEQIERRSWDKDSFKMWDVDFSNWLNTLEKQIYDREKFIEPIEINKLDKKISRLKSSELIP